MKSLFTIMLATSLAIRASGENLVVNPGFEDHKLATDLKWLMGGDMFTAFYVNGWTQPTGGSSDYFFRSDAASKMNIDPYGGPQTPASGNAFAGFIPWTPGRVYREYLCGQISQPLVKGKKYMFRMKISTGKNCPYLVNDLGVYFSTDRYSEPASMQIIKRSPQLWLDATSMHETPETWIEIKNVFIADGTEKYFIVGNFMNDTTTTVKRRAVASFACDYSYYYADDISLEETNEDPLLPGKATSLSNQVVAGNKFIARGINFDLDKSTLRPESYIQLHEIAAELKRKPSLKVEIRGYTDSTGNETHNLQLSKARAKVVADYLISTGIDKSRITSGGYGSADPLPYVDPELNRRVEFVFR